eukprot:PhF_6_TR21207/c0_g1_i1/m.30616/K02835/prfA, MTRF1, MRF1; peptide chain release factor 1
MFFRVRRLHDLPSHLIQATKMKSEEILSKLKVTPPPYIATVYPASTLPKYLWACATAVYQAGQSNDRIPEPLQKASAALMNSLEEGHKLHHMHTDEGEDKEIRSVAFEELEGLRGSLKEVEDRFAEVVEDCVPRITSSQGGKSVWCMSVKGGAGGTEAWIFAKELHGMYEAFCRKNRWKLEDTSVTDEDQRMYGLRVVGDDVKRYLRYEIGVHRVQRIPTTEAGGRLQTSTAVVTLIPQAEALDVGLKESDCDVTMTHGSGPGGQGVNKSYNCVRLIHRPTGIQIRCHQMRSGTENRRLAFETLSQKLWERKLRDANTQLSALLGAQWVSGERNDKIRTYNEPQNRVTDHRTDVSVSDYSGILRDGDLEPFHKPLLEKDDAEDRLMDVVLFTNSVAEQKYAH